MMQMRSHDAQNRFGALRTATTVLLAGGLAVGAAACSSPSSQASSTGSAATVKVGLITKTETNPYFVKLREAAKAEADKQGVKLVALAGKFDGDNEGQVSAIENLVSSGSGVSLSS